MKKKYVTWGTLIAIMIGVLVALNVPTHQGAEPFAITNPPVAIEAAAVATPAKTPTPAPPQAQVTKTVSVVPEVTSPTPVPNVQFLIAGKSYETFAPTGSNVLDAMYSIASTSDFVFTGKEYPSLGFFVESINGKTQTEGYVWIFYMNGKKSSSGISSTRLNPGDTVEWKYEKSF